MRFVRTYSWYIIYKINNLKIFLNKQKQNKDHEDEYHLYNTLDKAE